MSIIFGNGCLAALLLLTASAVALPMAAMSAGSMGSASGPPASPRAAMSPPRAESVALEEACAALVAVPAVGPQNEWRLEEASQGLCRERAPSARKSGRAAQRNWCWLSLKDKCHANLKAHLPWAALRDLAAQDGRVPPVDEDPFSPLEAPELCDVPSHGRARSWTRAERARAREWFGRNVAVYVLSLPADKSRWEMISSRLGALRIRPRRVEGVDMRRAGALQDARREGLVPDGYNFTLAQEVARKPEYHLGGVLGTLGCASGHFKAQAAAIADGSPLAVVLEDDVWLEDDFVERLWDLVAHELPCDWQVTSLYSRCPFGQCVSPRLARIRPDANEPEWRCRAGVNWGMQGMLYRTSELPRVRSAWRRVVFDEGRPHCMDVDVALASVSDEVSFYAVPSSQEPGFLRETNHESARWIINRNSGSKQHGPVKIGMPFPR